MILDQISCDLKQTLINRANALVAQAEHFLDDHKTEQPPPHETDQPKVTPDDLKQVSDQMEQLKKLSQELTTLTDSKQISQAQRNLVKVEFTFAALLAKLNPK